MAIGFMFWQSLRQLWPSTQKRNSHILYQDFVRWSLVLTWSTLSPDENCSLKLHMYIYIELYLLYIFIQEIVINITSHGFFHFQTFMLLFYLSPSFSYIYLTAFSKEPHSLFPFSISNHLNSAFPPSPPPIFCIHPSPFIGAPLSQFHDQVTCALLTSFP